MKPLLVVVITFLTWLNPACSCCSPLAHSSSISTGSDQPKSVIPTKNLVDAAEKAISKETGIDFSSKGIAVAAKAADTLLTAVVGETDSVKRYVLISNAAALASKAGEVTLALKAIDLLDTEFQVDAFALKAEVIQKRAKIRQPPANFYDLSVLCIKLASDAAAVNRYKTAIDILDDGIGYSKKIPEVSITHSLLASRELMKKYQAAFQEVEASLAELESAEKTRQSATIRGRFLCLTKGDWETGIPILALGETTNPLTMLAQRELSKPQKFDDIISLMDDWLRLAEVATDDDSRVVRKHAWDVGQSAFRVADATQLVPLELKLAKAFGATAMTRTAENENGLSLGGVLANPGMYATMELWIRTNDEDGSILTKRRDPADSSVGLDIEGGRICYYAHGPAHSSLNHTEMRINDGVWHHVAAVKLGDRLTVYVDGKLAGPSIIIQPDNLSKTAWHLGYMMVEQQSPLTATYARIRISSIARYHFNFEPQLDYSADAATLLFR